MNKRLIEYYNNFSKNLKLERKLKGLTQKAVANMLEIAPQSYQAYESGMAMPTVENLLKLSTIFNVSLDELFEIKF